MNLPTVTYLTSLLAAGLLCGCDEMVPPVRLDLKNELSRNEIVSVDSPEVKDALTILDGIVMRRGFQVAQNDAHRNSPHFIRAYVLYLNYGAKEDFACPCRVWLTPTGVQIEFGGLGKTSEAEDAAGEVTSAFIEKFGKKQVKRSWQKLSAIQPPIEQSMAIQPAHTRQYKTCLFSSTPLLN